MIHERERERESSSEVTIFYIQKRGQEGRKREISSELKILKYFPCMLKGEQETGRGLGMLTFYLPSTGIVLGIWTICC